MSVTKESYHVMMMIVLVMMMVVMMVTTLTLLLSVIDIKLEKPPEMAVTESSCSC